MKTFFIICCLSSAFCAKANASDTLPFQAKPPLKISKIDDRAVSIKISGDTAKKQQPLFIIDGVLTEPQEITIDPAMIEKIEVLKTDSNRFISCRPLARVILITTKKAKQKKMTVQDENDIGIPGASVSIVDQNNPADTINLIANDAGEIISNKLSSWHSYNVTVSSVGYRTKNLKLSFNKDDEKTISLNKCHIEYQPVTVIGYTATRRVVVTCCPTSVRTSTSYGANIRDIKQDALKIYPNPVSKGSLINIELPKDILGDARIQLFDFSGHLILQQEISAKSGMQKMQLPTIAAGAYQVIFISEQSKKSAAGKLVVL